RLRRAHRPRRDPHQGAGRLPRVVDPGERARVASGCERRCGMSGVAILGGFQTDWAKNYTREGRSLADLMRDTVQGALEATRLEAREVQVAHIGNFVGEVLNDQGNLGGLFVEADPAFDGIPTSRHEGACAAGSLAILAATADLEAGRYDV